MIFVMPATLSDVSQNTSDTVNQNAKLLDMQKQEVLQVVSAIEEMVRRLMKLLITSILLLRLQ